MIVQALWILGTCHLVITLGTQSPCSLTTMKLTINSYRNQTGHWVSSVSLKQGARETISYSGSWILELDQTSSTCKAGTSTLDTNLLLTAPPSKSSSQIVPDGYELFPGVGFYKYHPEVVNWPQAHIACISEGGHLVILNSEQENNIAVKIIARHPNAGAWFMTGIQEMGVHKQYFTIFNEPLEKTGFTRFYPGQDDAKGVADYGGMHRSGGYSDVSIGEKYPFICEYDLV